LTFCSGGNRPAICSAEAEARGQRNGQMTLSMSVMWRSSDRRPARDSTLPDYPWEQANDCR
jgi:hypothetical protein